ncbi:MAG: PadR family transcriptional regulator [Rhizomicrobium sp.]|jgi:PadR family transcriptional regulator PadR
MVNPNFMNGVPELLILRLLEEQEMYGYELVAAIRAKTGDAISLGEGVVYPVLHALEHEGALKSRRKNVNGRTRVYYTVTRTGEKRLAGLVRQWTHITETVSRAIKETSHVPAII